MKGQTLIEVLVALSIGAIVIAAVTSTVLSSLSSEQFSQNQSVANQFAQEGMDIALQNMSSVAEGSYCLDQGATTLPTTPPSGAIDGVFNGKNQCAVPNLNPNYLLSPNGAKTMKRTVTYLRTATTCPQALTQVIVVVSWTDSKCTTAYCHQAREETCH